MVIVVMSANPSIATDLGRRLAATLDWPFIDATRAPSAARDAIVHAHDRRTHTVVCSSLLTRSERRQVIGDTTQVRVVHAGGGSTRSGWLDDEQTLAVDTAADADGALATVRSTFGL